ncbi:hypothetical protein ACH5RR_032368 [Cinchona calisaya]|uniref:Reverse transcriptase domain-containing protein n=1 Tax=Cinchona calisaya TaxID=153742 RepID=A0ABD2YJ82_9GENT
MFEGVQSFMAGASLPKFFSSTLITLIPKIDNHSTFANFRPISLCTFVNKVYTKVMAKRLSQVLPRIISSEQAVFVNGKSIIENVMLAQELMGFIDRKQGVVI